ncbi:hypothetical protein ACFS3C_03485 [Azotobacter vinelandii]|nr:hypothetical protein [Azotobacter vinelandii]WKN22774.1 hypothetical protein AVAEIV_000779 [Azotobacter vinelandii]GLK58392.1 hypothetical protein GCM10017624_05490 [Azotobacter vinelandii]SFY25174.1 hypothetical protein SAMN04244547_04715 [Azotobacter vinelandii]
MHIRLLALTSPAPSAFKMEPAGLRPDEPSGGERVHAGGHGRPKSLSHGVRRIRRMPEDGRPSRDTERLSQRMVEYGPSFRPGKPWELLASCRDPKC